VPSDGDLDAVYRTREASALGIVQVEIRNVRPAEHLLYYRRGAANGCVCIETSGWARGPNNVAPSMQIGGQRSVAGVYVTPSASHSFSSV
jgi:hypothetical protein